ncbi:MAG: hypothetical protein IH851_12650 [Armatimonadetes bacterium]|nr:hypothetical protein [Armatimonadota bacterium]
MPIRDRAGLLHYNGLGVRILRCAAAGLLVGVVLGGLAALMALQTILLASATWREAGVLVLLVAGPTAVAGAAVGWLTNAYPQQPETIGCARALPIAVGFMTGLVSGIAVIVALIWPFDHLVAISAGSFCGMYTGVCGALTAAIVEKIQ